MVQCNFNDVELLFTQFKNNLHICFHRELKSVTARKLEKLFESL